MFRDLLPLIFLMVSAAVLYVVRERRRRMLKVQPRFPDASLEQTWESLATAFPEHPDRVFLSTLEFGQEYLVNRTAERLKEASQILSQAEQPRKTLRSLILERAGAALNLQAIAELDEEARMVLVEGYQPGTGHSLTDAVAVLSLEYAALRHHAKLKYDDATPNDWFHNFLWHAGPYIRERVQMKREFAVEKSSGAGVLAQSYDALVARLAAEALAVPPKKRFIPPDLPASN